MTGSTPASSALMSGQASGTRSKSRQPEVIAAAKHVPAVPVPSR